MSVRPALPLLVALATAAAPIAVASPSQAATDASKVVISEVYGGGGAAASTWSPRLRRALQPDRPAIDLAGMSVQYRSATGTANPTGVIALSGLDPGARATTSSAGPAGRRRRRVPDARRQRRHGQPQRHRPAPSSSPTRDGADGTADRLVTGNRPTWSTWSATAPPTPSRTAPVAARPRRRPSVARGRGRHRHRRQRRRLRAATRHRRRTPRPAAHRAAGRPDRAQTIEEIQGTGDTSPFAGKTVTTEGVVTAAYPTGGFNGFYLQTRRHRRRRRPGHAQHLRRGLRVLGAAAARRARIGDHVQVTGKVSEFTG